MLVKLGVSTMADICFGTARETHKCGWLNKSLLLKGKKKRKKKKGSSLTNMEKIEVQILRSNTWHGKVSVKGKYDLQGHLQCTSSYNYLGNKTEREPFSLHSQE